MKSKQNSGKLFSILLCIFLLTTMITPTVIAQESDFTDISTAENIEKPLSAAIENSKEACLASNTSTVAITGAVSYNDAIEGLAQLNQIRADNGASPLQLSEKLTRAANLRAAEIAVYYSHTRPDNSDCFSAYNIFGIKYNNAGENIALGQSSISIVTNAWKNSPGHFSNMINTKYTMVGIGCFTSKNGTKTWVQLFSGGFSDNLLSRTGNNTEMFSFDIDNSKLSVYSDKTNYTLKTGKSEDFNLYAKNQGTSFSSYSKMNVNYKISSNESVATYSNGKIYANGEGTAVLTLGTDPSHCVNVTVTVTDIVAVTGLSLSYTSLPIPKGETRAIEARITPSDASSQFVTWTSSDPSVARVSETTTKSATITAVSPGHTVITGTVGGKSASCDVYVQENHTTTTTVDVTGITINKRYLNQTIGEVTQIAGSTVPTDADDKTIIWSSDNPSVAALSTSPSGENQTSGSITTKTSTGAVYICAKSAGTAIITAKSGSYSITCKVTVSSEDNDEPSEVTKITLSSGDFTLNEGDSKTVSVSVFPSDAENKTITWRNDNANVVKMGSVSNSKLTIIAKKAGTAKITAVAGNCEASITVTVKASSSNSSLPFSDIKTNDWYYEYVNYAYQKQMMNGVGNGKFAPNDTISRAMIVQILYNLQNGKTTIGTADYNFKDVKSGDWYGNAVKWAASNRIVTGYENGTFEPNASVTREQFAVILYRYGAFKKCYMLGFNNLSSFKDSNRISSYALTFVKWAVENGIISGKTSDTIVPQGKATRAETAAMMKRFCEKYPAAYQ